MSSRFVKTLQTGLFLASVALCLAYSQDEKGARFSMATPDRWQAAGWWPTKGTPSRREYVGPDACTRCHADIATSQQKTPMFNAARRASDSAPLRQHQKLLFSDETFNYVLSREPTETRVAALPSQREIRGQPLRLLPHAAHHGCSSLSRPHPPDRRHSQP